MTEKELYNLSRKYLNGTLSPEERKLLQEWYEKDIDAEAVIEIQAVDQSEDEAALRNKIYSKLSDSVKVKELEVGKTERHKRQWLYGAAAAVVLLAMGYIFYANYFSKPQVYIANVQNDIKPGTSGAVLTLGNGKQVVLDSSTNSLISGNSSVSVTNNNGQLIYKNAADNAAVIEYNTLTTAKGNQYKLVLPDGTKVWLNAASSITYPTAFTGSERKVEVTGEAFFEVVHNTKMPFLVKAGQQVIEDIGTSFDVSGYTDDGIQKTTLVEGSIKIGKQVLRPGEQATVDQQGKVSSVKYVDIDNVTAWKDGKFRFHNADIHEIMRQAARWYDINVVYKDNIDATFSGGISRNVNLSGLLEELEYTQKVTFKIEGKKLIVQSKEDNN